MSDKASEPELFPVKMVYHRKRYAAELFDVDGDLLVGKTGSILNVFKEELKDMMIAKEIRFLHYMSKEPTYAYFITSNEQLDRFHIERTEGSRDPHKSYHVYIDEY